MSTDIRPELSEKSKYYIDKHRYYELKHFCLQYPLWQKTLRAVNSFGKATIDIYVRDSKASDPTYKAVEARSYLLSKITLIEKIAGEVNPENYLYLLKGVTEGLSYEHLRLKLGMKCSRNDYYESYRKFFYILNKARR